MNAAEIEELAGGCWVKDLAGVEDGQLISMRLGYIAMAETRREGRPCEHLKEPMRTYPAEVWDRCAKYVHEEILRRMAGKEGGSNDD